MGRREKTLYVGRLYYVQFVHFVHCIKPCQGDQTKEGEIHETCGTNRREVKFLQGFLGGKHEGKKWFGEQRS